MNDISFELAMPNDQDARQVFEWRNDPLTRKMSHDRRPKEWETYRKEYYSRLFSIIPLFIVENGERVGVVFFEKEKHPTHSHLNACSISINVAPDARKKGIAKRSLQAIKPWLRRHGFEAIVAYIREENEPSIKAFKSAGYKKVGDVYICDLIADITYKPVFIIAEAGSNWHVSSDPNVNKTHALHLIDAAANAGADAVKFQVFRPETTYVRNAGNPNYLQKTDDIWKLFEELAMPYDMIPELATHCTDCGIEFMASAFSLKDFSAILPYIQKVKIASYEISHPHLIIAAANSRKPTFLSTGAANLPEIEWAVNLFRDEGGQDLTLMQCTANYPAHSNSMNLRVIPELKKRFEVEVGLSDHSLDPLAAPIAAVALGAKAIEKHFTLDRKLPGPDHSFAITPSELKNLVQLIRTTEEMVGSGAKVVHPSEIELRHFAQRRIQATKNISQGEILREGENLDILRPGKQLPGAHPRFLHEIQEKKAIQDIPAGKGIHLHDVYDFSHLKAVLIDLDGTLVDTMPSLYKGYLDFLKHHGHEGTQEEFDSLVGAKLKDVIQVISEKYQFKQPQDELLDLYQSFLSDLYGENIQFFPGVHDFLSYAKKQGLKLAIVTSAPKEFVKNLPGSEIFDFIITPENVKKGKPSPEIYEHALKLLNVQPENALALEDSPAGVEAATQAGIPTIQLVHGRIATCPGCIPMENWDTVLHLFKRYYG